MSTWETLTEKETCSGCGGDLEKGDYVLTVGNETFCEGCGEDYEDNARNGRGWDDDFYDDYGGSLDFADPGGRSALRAETKDNPRNLPCPTCGREDVLTPADVALHYQCDVCADEAEGVGGY
jgi:hypothetical protein